MHFGNIKKYDIANGEGVRVSLFVSGCRNYCKNCFNPETWNFNYGKEFSKEVEEEILKALAPSYINGLTILGGEPFEVEKQRGVVEFVKRVKEAYGKESQEEIDFRQARADFEAEIKKANERIKDFRKLNKSNCNDDFGQETDLELFHMVQC